MSQVELTTEELVAKLERYAELFQGKKSKQRKQQIAEARAEIEPALMRTRARDNIKYYRRCLNSGDVAEAIGAVRIDDHLRDAEVWKRRALWSLLVFSPLSVVAVISAFSAISRATPSGMNRARKDLLAARIMTILAFVVGSLLWLLIVFSSIGA